MTYEENLVFIRGMLLAAEIEMQGMIAENKYHEALGQSPPYSLAHFLGLANDFGVGHNALLKSLKSGRLLG